MTNELEKQFFDTFGIEPKLTFYDLIRLKEDTNREFGGRCVANWQGETKEETIRRFSPKGWKVLECKDVYIYPQITDHILLELICIRCKELISIIKVKGDNREELKNFILKLCIEDYTFYSKISVKTYNELANNFKQQVRTLFEEQ